MLTVITTNVTYKVPSWEYCNLVSKGSLSKPSKECCRFCVKEGNGYRCALYNVALPVELGSLVLKETQCRRATAGFESNIKEEEPAPVVSPKQLIKSTIDEYNKICKKLQGQGYPAVLAEKVAREYLLGGD